MDIYAIILIALGLIIAIGFLKQFGILAGKGLIYAISGVALAFGIAIFQANRRKKMAAEFKKREEDLKGQEKNLRKLEEEFQASKEEVFAAEAALKSEKGKHAKKLADIEAETADNHEERKKRNNDMAISELLENF